MYKRRYPRCDVQHYFQTYFQNNAKCHDKISYCNSRLHLFFIYQLKRNYSTLVLFHAPRSEKQFTGVVKNSSRLIPIFSREDTLTMIYTSVKVFATLPTLVVKYKTILAKVGTGVVDINCEAVPSPMENVVADSHMPAVVEYVLSLSYPRVPSLLHIK